MKPTLSSCLFTLPVALALLSGCASKKYTTQPAESAPVTSVTTMVAPATLVYSGGTTPQETPADDQRVYSPAYTLPQQANASDIINNFRPAYNKLGNPRLVFYINRDIKGSVTASVTTTPTSSGNGVVVTKNHIADKQTSRDIERIAARPFLQAGATLADSTTLSTGTAETASTTTPSADVAIETLVTSRQITLPSVSGQNATITVPDIQMTAIRLSDSSILGQATGNDIVNTLPTTALRSIDVQTVLEATSLNLMSDITARAK